MSSMSSPQNFWNENTSEFGMNVVQLNGETPPTFEGNPRSVGLPATMISKWGAGLGLVVTISTPNGENTSLTHSTTWFHLASERLNAVSVRVLLIGHEP